MQSDRIRMLKVKQLIILLLRTLIIIVIILAFARPALQSVFKGNTRTSAVIIIDDSLYIETIFQDNKLLLLMDQQNIIRDQKKIKKTLTLLDIFLR